MRDRAATLWRVGIAVAVLVAGALSVISAHADGLASFYSKPQAIACGRGRFDPRALTAAHRTLPCGTRVRVTAKRSGKSVVVTITDRGPYVRGRVIDLSLRAAMEIDMVRSGVVPVRVQIVD